ncbi:MAG: SH3 domain-containing protein, partial [Duncaniella sp.]|nr:SH3 domain-containing protein [Duncaniella sp.]
MKSILSKIAFFIAVGATILTASCSKEVPETYVAVKMAGIELKSSPDAKSETVAPTSMGEIFRFTEFPADGWVKVRNIATGAEGYLDTLAFSRSKFPLLAPELAEQEVDEAYLVN